MILQCFFRIDILRDYFLDLDFDNNSTKVLASSLSQLYKKVFNKINFKSHVSPHEFLQSISFKSAKKFKIDKQGDSLQFLVWLINSLHQELRDKNDNSVISDCFRGSIELTYQDIEYVDGKAMYSEWKHQIKPFL